MVLCRKCYGELEITTDENEEVQNCPICGKAQGYIIATKGIKKEEDHITCTCEAPNFKMISHLNARPRSIYKYECLTCNNEVIMR